MTELQKLQQENKELKKTLKEGKEVFGNLDSILGISEAVNSGFLMFKLPSIISKVQSNPQLIENVATYNEKIQSINLD